MSGIDVFVWVALAVSGVGLLVALITFARLGRVEAPVREAPPPSRHIHELLESEHRDDEVARLRESLVEARLDLEWARGLAEVRSIFDGATLAERVVGAAAAMDGVDAVALSLPGRKPVLTSRGLNADEEATILFEPLSTPLVNALAIDFRYASNGGLRRLEAGLLVPLRSEEGDAVGTLGVFSRTQGHDFGDATADALTELAAAAGTTLENIRKVEELRESALRDPLTGLYNRSFFHQELMRQVARADRYERPLTVMVLDIDDFKGVNERLGHLEADAVLGEVGARISGSIRAADIAGRVGGDEFGIVLEGTELDASRLYERVKLSVAADQTLTGLRMTVSGGIAAYAGDHAERLFARAIEALRHAKREGKAQHRVAPRPGPTGQADTA